MELEKILKKAIPEEDKVEDVIKYLMLILLNLY